MAIYYYTENPKNYLVLLTIIYSYTELFGFDQMSHLLFKEKRKTSIKNHYI